MAGFRRAKYLTCFYCGCKTSTQYNSGIRHFECPRCDATNFLDRNGEITDPPATATVDKSNTVQYAVPQSSSPKSSSNVSSNDNFCDTCLKNQRLFTASLAQYLPGEPDAPDYAELEKQYYKFRRGLEERYPQICASCEPRVRKRLEQAAYTAKADTLRRMIDRSRKSQQTQMSSALDHIATLGRWLWLFGLLSQVLWHVAKLRPFIPRESESIGVERSLWAARGIGMLDVLLRRLPSTTRLEILSLGAGLVCIWWNPRFVQTCRGFTKHILGLRLWYMYQFAALLVRLLLVILLNSTDSDPAVPGGPVAMHCLGLAITLFVYIQGRRCVKIDTAPLFAASPARDKGRQPSSRQSEPEKEEDKNMSQVLNDIIRNPAPPSQLHSQPTPPSSSSARAVDMRSSSGLKRRQQANGGIDTLSLSNSALLDDGDDEMDWMPTHSKHRAFNTVGEREGQSFNEAPVEPKGPFWYRVPAAPTSLAQRVYNPPNPPRLHTSPVAKENPFAKSSRMTMSARTGDPEDDAPSRPVSFAEAKFFPQPPQNDPRNSLSDLFGQSFNLSQEERAEQEKASGWFGGFGFGGGNESGKKNR